MLIVSKDHGRVSVLWTDLDAPAAVPTVLLDEPLPAAMEHVMLSNRDMLINGERNLSGNISVFAVWSRALGVADAAALHGHYRQVLRRQDPEFRKLEAVAHAGQVAKACPYDTEACAACKGVSDWTDPATLLTASDTCRADVHRFCTNNPAHARCVCWRPAHPNYNTTCAAFRQAMAPARPAAIMKATPAPVHVPAPNTHAQHAQISGPPPRPSSPKTLHKNTTGLPHLTDPSVRALYSNTGPGSTRPLRVADPAALDNQTDSRSAHATGVVSWLLHNSTPLT